MTGAWIACCCAVVSSAALMLPTPGFADDQDDVFVSHTLACDSPSEIQSFIKGAADERIAAALSRVNHRYGRDACNVSTMLFKPQGEVKFVLGPEGLIKIEQVGVVGLMSRRAMMQFSEPVTQYVAIVEKGLDI